MWGVELTNRVPKILVTAWLVLLPPAGLAQSESPDALLRLFKGDTLTTEMFPGESVEPPYRIEVWVDSAHGLHKEGAKAVIEDCLREDLRALGDVEFVHFLSPKKPRPSLRLRVWFSQMEKPDAYNCFDMTLAVVVGKVYQDNPLAEFVIDAYGLAGIAAQDLNALCQKIATRLDVKILAALRRMKSSSEPK